MTRYTSFFAHFYHSYGFWFMPKFCFCSISQEQIEWFSPNFIYAFILTRSSLRLMRVIFRTFIPGLWPFTLPKFHFCSLSCEQIDRISPNLFMHLYWQDLHWDCYISFFAHLYQCYGIWFMPKLVSVPYLENKWTEFHQILHMHLYWQDLRWDCYISFFVHFYQSGGPWFTPKFRFHSISCEQMDNFWPNFIYISIYTDKIYVGIVSSQICKNYGPWLMSELRYHSIYWENLAFYCMQSTAARL